MKTDLILPNFSLGWELEAIAGARKSLKNVQVDHDGSVHGDGLEYRTSRHIVYDANESLAALRHLATDPHLETDNSCGFHVHIGLGRRSKMIHKWAAAFVALARHIEAEAFAAVPPSRRGNEYCKSWENSRSSVIKKEYSGNKHSCQDRYNWINPVEVFRPRGIRTIEIRLMGESHRYPYLLAWISFCRLMAASAWALAVEGDLSREQEEIDSLREVLRLIRKTFQESCASRVVAKNTVYLAYKARLLHPYGNPLTSIQRIENAIYYESFKDERERDNFQSLIREMETYVRRVQEDRASRPDTTPFQVGDTVEWILDSIDNVTRGRRYRVTADSRDGIARILGDNATEWFVDTEGLRLVARPDRELEEARA